MNKELDFAETAFESGDLATAMRLTKKCLPQDIDNGRGWELLGLIHYARGRFSLAVSSLERASLFVPLRPAARVCLSRGYARIGRLALSRDLLFGLISDRSLTVPLLLQVAIGLDALGQSKLAMFACRAASERDPDEAQPYYDLGYYSARCGYPKQLTESLARKAISLDPNKVCYRLGLASLLIKDDRQDEALDLIRRLTNDQIEQISCRECLRRVINLFEQAQDYRRVILCRQQLLALELREADCDCE